MTKSKYEAFKALDPFFRVVEEGLGQHVDGDHYFDTHRGRCVLSNFSTASQAGRSTYRAEPT